MKLIFLAMCLWGEKGSPHIRGAAEAFQAGSAAQAKGQTESAINFFKEAIHIEPTFMEARKAIIHADLDLGHKLEAAKALTQFLEIDPEDVGERIQLGSLLIELKERERALAQFSTALRFAPKNADALLGFAKAAAQLGLNDRAKEALDRGRQLYPSDRRFATSVLTKPIN